MDVGCVCVCMILCACMCFEGEERERTSKRWRRDEISQTCVRHFSTALFFSRHHKTVGSLQTTWVHLEGGPEMGEGVRERKIRRGGWQTPTTRIEIDQKSARSKKKRRIAECCFPLRLGFCVCECVSVLHRPTLPHHHSGAPRPTIWLTHTHTHAESKLHPHVKKL